MAKTYYHDSGSEAHSASAEVSATAGSTSTSLQPSGIAAAAAKVGLTKTDGWKNTGAEAGAIAYWCDGLVIKGEMPGDVFTPFGEGPTVKMTFHLSGQYLYLPVAPERHYMGTARVFLNEMSGWKSARGAVSLDKTHWGWDSPPGFVDLIGPDMKGFSFVGDVSLEGPRWTDIADIIAGPGLGWGADLLVSINAWNGSYWSDPYFGDTPLVAAGDFSNTLGLKSVTLVLPDGNEVTPESLGLTVSFWSGMPSPNLDTQAIPEPSSLIIWSLLGVVGITVGWRRHRRAA